MKPHDFETGRRPGPADWLTVPGRLLLIATIAGGTALFCFYFLGTFEELPPGRYPILFWLVPVALAAGAFFFGAALLLERLGVRRLGRDAMRELLRPDRCRRRLAGAQLLVEAGEKRLHADARI